MKSRSFSPERMAGAIAWRFVFLGVQGGASVILFSVLAHVLPRAAFEATAVSLGVLVIAQSIGDFGLSQAAVTMLPARIVKAPESAPALLAGAAVAYFWAGAAALILALAAALIVPHAAALPVAVSAPAAAATVLVTGADGILRSQGEFRRPVLLVAASELAGFAAIPVAAATGSATWTCVAMSAGTALGSAGSVAVLLHFRGAGSGVAPAVKPFVRASVPLGLAQVFIALGSRVDTLLAGALSGLLAAATFEGAWRTYQLGQYAMGAVATAAAPFVADALGDGRSADALRLVRRLLGGLLALGAVVGAVLYLARGPLALLLTGTLSGSVARVLPIVAVLSPVAAIGLVAFYTLITRERQRRYVLAVIATGAVVNLALAAILARSMGARGVMIGCAVGLAVANLLLLLRLFSVLRDIRAEDAMGPAAREHGVLAHRPG